MSFVKASASPPSSPIASAVRVTPAGVAVEQRHVGAGPGQLAGGGGPDAPPRPGDDRDPALEREHVRDLGHGPPP